MIARETWTFCSRSKQFVLRPHKWLRTGAAACWLALAALLAAPAMAYAQFGPSGIVDAVQKDYVAELRQMIIGGASPNTRTADGKPVLVVAAELNRENCVLILLYSGARPNDRDRSTGESALTAAARKGYMGIVSALLQAGADPDQSGPDGETPLILATINNHADVVEALIKGKADVNLTGYTGRTPLAEAEERNARKIADLLRAAGGTL